MDQGWCSADALDRGTGNGTGRGTMKRSILRRPWLLAGCAALVAVSGMVAAQESLLPPGFDNPPTPSRAAPAARSSAPAAAARSPASAAPAPAATASPVVQSVPSAPAVAAAAPVGASDEALLDTIDPALFQKLIDSATPKYDIPPSGQRSLGVVGVIAQSDGGFPAASTHYLSGQFVAGMVSKMSGQFVSRWGHILVRRAMASRLATPVGMNGADWAAMRAQLLLRMGEGDAARAMVQSVDSGNFTPGLEDAAMASFLATADPVGLCPITALTASGRPGWDWELSRAICSAFTGDGPPALATLDRAMRRGTGQKIDILLAQKFAGAATNARRAVTIEWTDVDMLTPWRTGMSLASGLEPPAELRDKAGPAYLVLASRAPMLPLASRATAADYAAGKGILSSAAMVDLYSQIFALRQADEGSAADEWSTLAETLRSAYVAPDESDRLDAIRTVWGDASNPDRAYSRLVLTAYAAARMVPSESLAADAGPLISSMLSAGLDRNAVRWAPFLPVGSEGWGLVVLASPTPAGKVGSEGLNAFYSDDDSTGSLRSRLLLAGLMGLGRADDGAARDFAGKLKLDLGRQTRWSRAIDAAAASNNPALVAMLAGFGMQGQSWDKMTAVHLYHIVSALRRVGLEAEARMIAAEAVSRA